MGILCTVYHLFLDLSVTKFILITDTDRSLDWETRHGRGVALSVAAKEAPEKVLTEEYKKRVINAASEISQADRVCKGVKCVKCE